MWRNSTGNDAERKTNCIDNNAARAWLEQNIPFFKSSDKELESSGIGAGVHAFADGEEIGSSPRLKWFRAKRPERDGRNTTAIHFRFRVLTLQRT